MSGPHPPGHGGECALVAKRQFWRERGPRMRCCDSFVVALIREYAQRRVPTRLADWNGRSVDVPSGNR
jgi:hypothetical protein